jgi:hypothetical protein
VRFRKKYVKHKDDVWLNMMAGAIGGLLGSWTMNQFQADYIETAEPATCAGRTRHGQSRR